MAGRLDLRYGFPFLLMLIAVYEVMSIHIRARTNVEIRRIYVYGRVRRYVLYSTQILHGLLSQADRNGMVSEISCPNGKRVQLVRGFRLRLLQGNPVLSQERSCFPSPELGWSGLRAVLKGLGKGKSTNSYGYHDLADQPKFTVTFPT
jgi:hypothetical protein